VKSAHNIMYKTLGAKWLFELRFSHQSSVYLARKVVCNPLLHISSTVSGKRIKNLSSKISDRKLAKW